MTRSLTGTSLISFTLFTTSLANSRTQRKLTEPCSLGVRAIDMLDNSTLYDCFCDLQGADKPSNNVLSRVSIHRSLCQHDLLDVASTNQFDLYVEHAELDTDDQLVLTHYETVKVKKRDDDSNGNGNVDKNSRSIGRKDNSELQRTSTMDISLSEKKNVFLRSNRVNDKLRRNNLSVQYRLLVVNVAGADYPFPSTEDKLQDDWFLDSASLATQIRDCSANQMTFIPYPGVNNGVTSIAFNQNIAGIGTRSLERMVLEELQSRGLLFGEAYMNDKVAICLPAATFTFDPDPSYQGAAAYGYANGYIAVFRGNFCNRISIQMHEVGHNLGLAHSGDSIDVTNPLPTPGKEEKLGDGTGAMGGYQSADDYEICYNAAKTWQLGWRPSINMFWTSPETYDLTLTSFVDWDSTDESQVCIARVVTPKTLFYVHYNRKAGSNANVREYGDQVVVATTMNSKKYSELQSSIVAALDAGSSYTLENIDGLSLTLIIAVIEIGDVSARVAITLAEDSPSISPSVRPMSSSPSSSPTPPSSMPGKGFLHISLSTGIIRFPTRYPTERLNNVGQSTVQGLVPKAWTKSTIFRGAH